MKNMNSSLFSREKENPHPDRTSWIGEMEVIYIK